MLTCPRLVECLNRHPSSSTEAQGSQDDIRIEAAHVISSISYGELSILFTSPSNPWRPTWLHSPLSKKIPQKRLHFRTGCHEPKSERHVAWPSKLTPPSLSGSQEALQSLLRADAPQALLYAISNFRSTDSIALKAAFARALRALTVAISETVGPSQWGLRPDTSDIRYEAKAALNYLFQVCGLNHFTARQI